MTSNKSLISFLCCSAFLITHIHKQNKIQQTDTDADFTAYLQHYHKDYDVTSKEYQLRHGIFQSNQESIERHNRNVSGTSTYRQGVNKFTDRRSMEIFKGYDKLQHPSFQGRSTLRSSNLEFDYTNLPFQMDDIEHLPTEVDWRTSGIVSPVKDQGACGSCWAFATTEIVESSVALHTIRNGNVLELSPQQLVDCVVNDEHCGGSGGCSGATVELGLEYILKAGGMVLEDDLIYEGKDDVCPLLLQESMMSSVDTIVSASASPQLRRMSRSEQGKKVASIKDYIILPTNNYQAVMNAVAKMGPVAVSVDASHWYLYKSGIYSDEPDELMGYDIDHAVVLVGYGTDDVTGLDYWLIRNSWGSDWGEDGYIRIKRSGDVLCYMDNTPLDGSGCSLDENGDAIIPDPVEVCGMDGILFDVVVPLGGYLVDV